MRSIPDRATILIDSILLQDAQLRAAGLKAEQRALALRPGVMAYLQTFDDELLDAQRAAGVALAKALNMTGGKQ